jgi:cyclopropane fatty-acyl-phospholipid synthase-like methyltransferase
MELVKPKSVLDVGCGIGTWLKAFEENGVTDYKGLDGNHVDRSLLKIPKDKFQAQNLMEPWDLRRKFDLVISLEVAEHLNESASDLFVEMLVKHGETIIFSAALPKQEGQNHLNEQWPSYWQEKFEKHGYYFHDVIRPKIWFNPNVQWWYSQNMFLVTREKSDQPILNMIHPVVFTERMTLIENILSGEIGVAMSWQILRKAFSKWINKKLGSGTRKAN